MKKKPQLKLDLTMLGKESKKFKMDSTTSQVILAAVAVLIVFLVALMSSMPRKETTGEQLAPGKEIRTGTQTAQITVLRNGEAAPAADTQAQQPATTQPILKSLAQGNAVPNGTGQTVSGYNVKFKIDSFKKLATQPLKFNIYDAKGGELTPEWLQTQDEQKVHLIIVSANLREYQHLNPEYSNGTWNTGAYLPTPGTYYAMTSIDPVKGSPVVINNNLTVREASKGQQKYPGLTPDMFAITEGVRATLTLNSAGAGKSSTLTYQISKDGKVVTDVRPAYGAFGYVLVFNQAAPAAFIKADAVSDAAGNISFAVNLPSAGRYTSFAQFNVAGKVLLFPITFDVK